MPSIGGEKGSGVFYFRFGRPRECMFASSPSCLAMLIVQSSLPKGRTRCALDRRSSNSDTLSGSLIKSTGHFAIGVWTPLATKGDVQPPLETPAIFCPQRAAGNIRFNPVLRSLHRPWTQNVRKRRVRPPTPADTSPLPLFGSPGMSRHGRKMLAGVNRKRFESSRHRAGCQPAAFNCV